MTNNPNHSIFKNIALNILNSFNANIAKRGMTSVRISLPLKSADGWVKIINNNDQR